MIIGGVLLQYLISCAFAFTNSYEYMLLVRFLYGFSFGLTAALTSTMYSEVVPTAYRGKGLILLSFCMSVGKVLSLGLAYIFLTDFTHGDWRSMMVASSLPNIIILAGACFSIYESPRFLLAIGSYDSSF
jgi:MFS family permease